MFETTEVEETATKGYEGRKAAIDFDEIAYVAAAGNETRGIRVKENVPFATWKEHSTRTDFYKSIGGKSNAKDYVIEDVQYPFSIEKCYHKIDEMVQSILERCKTEDYVGYMGSGSPRDFIATVMQYKGQRGSMLRPVQLKEARQYCKERWNAIEVDGTQYEADDMLAIETATSGAISVSQDKDAYQVEGWLLKPAWAEPRWMDGFGYFDVDKSGKSDVAVGAGECFLAYQCLVGDSSDNYKPTKLTKKNFGMAGAKKLIDKCGNSLQLWGAVIEKYKEWYPEPFTYPHAYTGEEMIGTWHNMFNEYYMLARMKRTLDDCATGYDLLEALGVDYE